MVKLYYTPSSCGASSFISAFVANLNFDCEIVDLSTHTTESGVDFYTINQKGNVPALVLDDGTVLNENIACLEYIADQATEVRVAPQHGSNERYVLLQVLSYIASELHPAIGGLFNPASKNDPVIRSFLVKNFERKMVYIQEKLLSDERQFVVGNSFTVADAYLHIALSWLSYVGLNLEDYPIANNYYSEICELQTVQEAKKRMNTHPNTTV